VKLFGGLLFFVHLGLSPRILPTLKGEMENMAIFNKVCATTSQPSDLVVFKLAYQSLSEKNNHWTP